MKKQILFFTILQLLGVAASAQESKTSLPETLTWLEKKITEFTVSHGFSDPNSTLTALPSSMSSDGCRVAMFSAASSYDVKKKSVTKYDATVTLSLSDLDPDSIKITENQKEKRYAGSEFRDPVWTLQFNTVNRSKLIKLEFSHDPALKAVPEWSVSGFSGQEPAARYAKALTHAVNLCQAQGRIGRPEDPRRSQ